MEKQLNTLKCECENCKRCELYQSRKNMVFGSGNENSQVLFVGEAPGEKEDESGMPFVGRSGKLFDKYLEKIGMNRSQIYIANMLKCRPPKNRDPKKSEMDECIQFLYRQIEILNPKLIVCLGRISAMRLIKPSFKITLEHGEFFNREKYKICAVYHPSLILRDPTKGADFLEDMQKIKSEIDCTPKKLTI